MVNNYLIEYFVNPPKQIKKYFEEDYKDLRPHSMVQFLTGRIIFDKFDEIKKLKEEAKGWMNKEPNELKDFSLELMKYNLWDLLDNLSDGFEQDREDFDFVYYNSLRVLYEEYARYLRKEIIPFDQVFRYMSDPHFLEKYLAKGFPDTNFRDKFLHCLKDRENASKMKMYEDLTEYVLDQMGGFTIDGWKIRSLVD